MKKKKKVFTHTKWDASATSQLVAYLDEKGGARLPSSPSLTVRHGNESLYFRSVPEFVSDLRRGYTSASLFLRYEKLALGIDASSSDDHSYVEVAVEGEDAPSIEAFFELVEKLAEKCHVDPKPAPVRIVPKPTVFIGHGRSPQWRDLKDHLTDKHGIQVVAFEVGSRAGHTIRDILDEMLKNSTIAFLVLTAEDELADGSFHARENVIHELGLFQGRLGFSRAIALLESGANEFSNLHGIQQIRFTKGSIRETFGEVLATIRREFQTEGA